MPYWALLVGMLASPHCVSTLLDAVFPPANVLEPSPPPPSKPEKGKKSSSTSTVAAVPERGGVGWVWVVKVVWLGFMVSVLYGIANSGNVSGLRNDLAHAQCGIDAASAYSSCSDRRSARTLRRSG